MQVVTVGRSFHENPNVPPQPHAPTLSHPGPCGWGPRRSAAAGVRETSLQLSPPLSLETLKSKDNPCIYFAVFVPYPSPKTWPSAVHVVGIKSTDAWWGNGYVKSGEINTLWKRDCLSFKGMMRQDVVVRTRERIMADG